MKNIKIKKATVIQKPEDIQIFCKQKIEKYEKMIESTILATQKYKTMDIIGVSELNTCIQNLEVLFRELENINISLNKKKKKFSDIINRLQNINNELSIIFRSFGTEKIEDLITVCFGQDFINTIITKKNKIKYEVIKKYIHPIGYKVMTWKKNNNPETKTLKLAKNRIVEDFMIVEKSENLDCFDLARTSRSFQTKVYGIKLSLQNYSEKKTLIICGIVDDIVLQCVNHTFLKNKIISLKKNRPKDPDFKTNDYNRFLTILTLKELLIYDNDELYQKYIGYLNQANLMKRKTISQVVKEFINNELYNQRTTLIQLLIKHNNPEFQYLAYLLYDLLSNEDKGNIDTVEQTLLFDSLPWTIKKYFRDAMINTTKYTKNLSNFDNNKIPIEQQICLMKTTDEIKEKAMIKLKEVKSKSEDSGSKARLYLDGLLKIPFNIYKNEPILNIINDIHDSYKILTNIIKIPTNKKSTSLEIFKTLNKINTKHKKNIHITNIELLIKLFTTGKRDTLVANTCFINSIAKKNNIIYNRLCHSGKKNDYMRKNLIKFIKDNTENNFIYRDLKTRFPKHFLNNEEEIITKELKNISFKKKKISTSIKQIGDILDNAIYGHNIAKRQIMRIIAQWINGENSGYCFGFEGPPGIGKTSLAKKGLSACLVDNEGNNRPFKFIALGGSSNGSTIIGHNYTYVGSTWGRIVDILMETKCMNPIIFIDELDKVSRTEHGKEIIGILTHLVDPTQNESFQDKYFNGIDLNLSKALIIFSYNDPNAIDKILLDRIHRIKFNYLTTKDKIVISKKYLIPELLKKMGLDNMILFSDDIIRHIIEQYTNEAGVRKLKEFLFEIIGEINLEVLSENDIVNDIPINLTEDDIDKKYLKERKKIRYQKIHDKPCIGIINGMWANIIGKGGVLPIQCNWFPSSNDFELKLTGMQGTVMKESMHVAKTIAWNLTDSKMKKKWLKEFKLSTMKGIHVHCPEGATPKDGPSAGTAITISMISLFNNRPIKNTVSITGEINLQGNVTAIGGLDLKIRGAIKAGITDIIFPKENEIDFLKYCEKNEIGDIKFHKVSNITEVMELVFI